MVALGTKTAALFSNNRHFASQIQEVGEEAGERYWRLPITADMLEMMHIWAPEGSEIGNSGVADLNNVSPSKYGGSIEGAAFLANFFNWESPQTKSLKQVPKGSLESEELSLQSPNPSVRATSENRSKSFHWAHLDIAGPAVLDELPQVDQKEIDLWMNRSDSTTQNKKVLLNAGLGEYALMKEGATGFGVSTIVKYCQTVILAGNYRLKGRR